MKILDNYLKLEKEIFDYFGYVEDWRRIPIDNQDTLGYFWRLDGEGPGTVRYAESEEILDNEDGKYWENEIYTQRHLPKWVYRGKDYTMVVVDTHMDGNQYLQIFDNSLERT